MSLFCTNQILISLIFLCGSFVNTADKQINASVINFFDPLNVFRELTGDFLSKNVYEQRQIYCESIKKDLFAISTEVREKDFKESQDFLKSFNQKRESIPAFQDEVLSRLANEIIEDVSERTVVWDSYLSMLEEFNNFTDRHKDLIDEAYVLRYFQDLNVQGSFSLEDLRFIEKKISDLNQEKDALLKRRSAIEVQKIEDELSLDFLKKEEENRRKAELSKGQKKQSAVLSAGEDLTTYLEKLSVQKKMEVIKLKVDKAAYQVSLLAKEWELLKYKYKYILEPSLKTIKSKLVISLKELESLRIKMLAREQELVVAREDIVKKINIKKEEKNKLTAELNKLKSKLKQRKDNLDKGANDNEALQEIFLLDTHIIKIKHDIELVDQEKTVLEINRRKLNLDSHFERFGLLRAEAFYYSGNHDEKALTNHLRNIVEVEIPDVTKQSEGLTALIYNAENYLASVSISKKMELRERVELFQVQKNSLFIGKRAQQQEHSDLIHKSELLLEEVIKKSNEIRLLVLTLEKSRKELLDHLENLRKEIGDMVGIRNKWHRSANAITWENLEESLRDVELFATKFFWDTKDKLNPIKIFYRLVQSPLDDYVGFLIILLLFGFSSYVLYFLIKKLKAPIDRAVVIQSDKIENRYALFGLISITMIIDNFILIYGWIFTHVLIHSQMPVFGFSMGKIDGYYLSLFYLVSMVMFVIAATRFLALFNSFNKSMNYFFFSEKATFKNMVLLSVLFFTTALLFPFWNMISSYSTVFKDSILRVVLKAAYSLISVMVMFFFLDKEDVLGLIPKYGSITVFFKRWLEFFYYPLFIFCIGIYIIFNPYIGYTNLGWYLLFIVPLTAVIVLGAYLIQSFNRTYFQRFFFSATDSDSEFLEKFDHAELLYGLSVIASFCILSLTGYLAVSKLWTGEYNLIALWKNVSENWTISVGDKDRLGLVQLFTFFGFLFSGYLITTFLDRAVLRRLFDLFRVDAGLENTISKIFQYIMVILFVVLAFVAVNLSDFVKYVIVALTFGLSLGMRDQISDFFAGILILLERQLEMGHYIEFTDDKTNYRGTVHKISIRSTTISTVRNFFISIPNRFLISRPIVNWGAGRVAVGMEFDLKVAFGSDPEKICALIKQVIYENPVIHKVPAVVVRLDEFSEYGMVFFARAFISARKVREQWDIAAAIRTEIIKVFKENNIELAYPHTLVHLSSNRSSKKNMVVDPVRINFDNNRLG